MPLVGPGPGSATAQNNAFIKSDLEGGLAKPKSAIGMIVAGLRQRKEKGLKSFTVLSCDNLPENGDKVTTETSFLYLITVHVLCEGMVSTWSVIQGDVCSSCKTDDLSWIFRIHSVTGVEAVHTVVQR